MTQTQYRIESNRPLSGRHLPLREGRQLVLDFRNRPTQPDLGQLWLF